jgi:predicted component of type VI protein secretion system
MKASIIRAFTVVFIAATLIIEACSKKQKEPHQRFKKVKLKSHPLLPVPLL